MPPTPPPGRPLRVAPPDVHEDVVLRGNGGPIREDSLASLAKSLDALSSDVRLSILVQLQQPKALREIAVSSPPEPGREPKPLARQTVKEHLERMVAMGVVLARPGERKYGGTTVYLLNQQRLFAIAEAFRDLACMKPSEDLGGSTLHHAPHQAAQAPASPSLVLVKGLAEGRTFRLAPPPSRQERTWLIGRKRTAHVSLDFDPYVSMEHAQVGWSGQGFVLRDLATNRNGTTLNFAALPKGGSSPLRNGDVVGVGRTFLLFRAAQAPGSPA